MEEQVGSALRSLFSLFAPVREFSVLQSQVKVRPRSVSEELHPQKQDPKVKAMDVSTKDLFA